MAAADARNIFSLVRKSIDARAVQQHVRKPFRFLLCGDPALVAELRALLLIGNDETQLAQAAACLETIRPGVPLVTNPNEVRAIVFLGRAGDAAAADFEALRVARVPVLALTIDPAANASGPATLPAVGEWSEYVAPAIAREALRGAFLRSPR